MSRKYWNRERIIQRILAWNKKHGRAPYATEWFSADGKRDRYGHVLWPSTSIVQREFGSWRKAIHAAGLTPPAKRPKREEEPALRVPQGFWKEEMVVAKVKEWVAEHGSPPAVHEWRGKTPLYPDTSTVIDLFGSWNNMVRTAGFVPRPRGVNARSIRKYRPLLGNRPEDANAPTEAGADREES